MDNISIFFELSVATIEAIQLSSLGFVSQLNWSSIDTLMDIAKIRLDFNGPGYIDCFIAVIIISLAYFLYGSLLPCFGEALGEINVYIWFFLGKQILFGILFTPLLTLIIQVFYCNGDGKLIKDEDFTCWKGDHAVFAFLAILTLCLFIPAAIYKSLAQDLESRDVNKKTAYKFNQRYMDGKYLMIRLAIVTLAAGYSSPSSLTRIICAFVILCLTLLPPIYFLCFQPHKFWLLNVMKSSLYSATAWSALSALTVASSSSSSSSSSLILLGSPLVLIVMIILASLFYKRFAVSAINSDDWMEVDSEYRILTSREANFATCRNRYRMKQKSQGLSDVEEYAPVDGDNAITILLSSVTGLSCLLGRIAEKKFEIQELHIKSASSVSFDEISSDLEKLLLNQFRSVVYLNFTNISFSRQLISILHPQTSIISLAFYDDGLTSNQAQMFCQDVCGIPSSKFCYLSIGKCSNANQISAINDTAGSPLIEVK